MPPLPPLVSSTDLGLPPTMHLCYNAPTRPLCTLAAALAVGAPPQLVAIYGYRQDECANSQLYEFGNGTYAVAFYVNGKVTCSGVSLTNMLAVLAPQLTSCTKAPATMCSAGFPMPISSSSEVIQVFDEAATSSALQNVSTVPALPPGTLLYTDAMAATFLQSAAASRYSLHQVAVVSARLDSVLTSSSKLTDAVRAFSDALAADAGVKEIFIQRDACSPNSDVHNSMISCFVVAAFPWTSSTAPSVRQLYHVTNSAVYHAVSVNTTTGVLAEPLASASTTSSSSENAGSLRRAAMPVVRYVQQDYPSTDSGTTLAAWVILILLLVLFCAAIAITPFDSQPNHKRK